eukprot:TRINITY_DN2749_c0_g1_i4.p1 TRINITY_DN2749_c0_g1~~TRINITY_DN2749_c0_g1_i4.p1  ORF type:complete len:631 (-),score=77.99 TRINITY_DN2749_c0_g1_i4:81-1973(-)
MTSTSTTTTSTTTTVTRTITTTSTTTTTTTTTTITSTTTTVTMPPLTVNDTLIILAQGGELRKCNPPGTVGTGAHCRHLIMSGVSNATALTGSTTRQAIYVISERLARRCTFGGEWQCENWATSRKLTSAFDAVENPDTKNITILQSDVITSCLPDGWNQCVNIIEFRRPSVGGMKGGISVAKDGSYLVSREDAEGAYVTKCISDGNASKPEAEACTKIIEGGGELTLPSSAVDADEDGSYYVGEQDPPSQGLKICSASQNGGACIEKKDNMRPKFIKFDKYGMLVVVNTLETFNSVERCIFGYLHYDDACTRLVQGTNQTNIIDAYYWDLTGLTTTTTTTIPHPPPLNNSFIALAASTGYLWGCATTGGSGRGASGVCNYLVDTDLATPTGMAVSKIDDSVYVVERTRGKVCKRASTGANTSNTTDDVSSLWTCSIFATNISLSSAYDAVYDLNTDKVVITQTTGLTACTPGMVDNCTSIADFVTDNVEEVGGVNLANGGGYLVARRNDSGWSIAKCTSGSCTTVVPNLTEPSSAVDDADGNYYVGVRNQGGVKVCSDGVCTVQKRYVSPNYVKRDRTDMVLVVDEHGNRVERCVPGYLGHWAACNAVVVGNSDLVITDVQAISPSAIT